MNSVAQEKFLNRHPMDDKIRPPRRIGGSSKKVDDFFAVKQLGHPPKADGYRKFLNRAQIHFLSQKK